MQSVSFIKIDFEQPKDGQDVWLLRAGAVIPVPACYHHAVGDVRPAEFSLLNGTFSYGRDSSWAPMEVPENANMAV